MLPPHQQKEFLEALHHGGYGAIDSVLTSIASEDAEATEEDDLHAIQALVEALPGQCVPLVLLWFPVLPQSTSSPSWCEGSVMVHS